VIVEKLEEHIYKLALREPDSAPVISCYLDCTGGPAGCQKLVSARSCELGGTLTGAVLPDFERALRRIQRYLQTEVGNMTRGIAVFAREGVNPFFLALQFEVPLPDWIAVASTPDLFHLVELEDNYDRYAIVPASARDRVSDIITSTLACFLQHEETESQAIADRLVTQIYTNGLAVAGAGPTLQALKSRQADFLVIAKNYEPSSGWECRNCGRMDLSSPDPNFCPDCRNRSVRQFDVRAEMVRLAKQQLCGVEVVEHSDAWLRVGGIGCLLRFMSSERYASQAA
jgi:hypothetical protein